MNQPDTKRKSRELLCFIITAEFHGGEKKHEHITRCFCESLSLLGDEEVALRTAMLLHFLKEPEP